MAYCDHGYGRPSLRVVGSTLRGVVPCGTESSRKLGVPRVFLRQAQDKLSLADADFSLRHPSKFWKDQIFRETPDHN